jgi:hypothetical protein
MYAAWVIDIGTYAAWVIDIGTYAAWVIDIGTYAAWVIDIGTYAAWVIDIGTYVHNTYACDIWASQDPIGPALGPCRSRDGMGLLGNPT